MSAAKADPAHPGSLAVTEDFVCQTPSLTWVKVAARAAARARPASAETPDPL